MQSRLQGICCLSAKGFTCDAVDLWQGHKGPENEVVSMQYRVRKVLKWNFQARPHVATLKKIFIDVLHITVVHKKQKESISTN